MSVKRAMHAGLFLLAGTFLCLAQSACGTEDNNIDRDTARNAAEQYQRIALEERKKWIRVLGSGLAIQLWPLVDGKQDRRRMESMGVKLNRFISLNGNGIWAIHVTVKPNARKNPKGSYKPFMLVWYENNKRRARFNKEALVPVRIVQEYAKERIEYTFSNGTRTDLRIDIYHNKSVLESRLKRTRENLLR